MSAGPWNWLELAKLLASCFVPIALAVFGIYIHHVTKRFEHLQWRSQKLIEKRLEVYDVLTPELNDLLCYFTFVGSWKELDPPDVVARKRKIDKIIHLAAPLFSKSFFSACMEFQKLCFDTYNGWGSDAKLKTSFQRRLEARENWKTEWSDCFCLPASDPKEIGKAYMRIMEVLANDIGVHTASVVPQPGRSPNNIK